MNYGRQGRDQLLARIAELETQHTDDLAEMRTLRVTLNRQDAEYERLRINQDTMLASLTTVQTRCTELLEEIRIARIAQPAWRPWVPENLLQPLVREIARLDADITVSGLGRKGYLFAICNDYSPTEDRQAALTFAAAAWLLVQDLEGI